MKKYITLLLILIPIYSFSADLESTVRDAFEYYSVNNFSEAAPMFEEAYYMAKKNTPKDISSRFRTSLYAALSYRGMGEYHKASEWFLISLTLAEKGKDIYDIPILLSYLAESERMVGRAKKAEEYYLKALKYADLTDKDKAVLYYGLAESRRINGNYYSSKESCDRALRYAEKLKLYKIISSCDIIYGEYYRHNEDYSKAMYYFTRAHDTSRARKFVDILVPASNGLGLTSEALNRPDAAREYFEQAFFVAVENGAIDSTDIIYKKIIDYMPEKGSFKYQGDKAYELASLDYLDDDTSLLLYNLSALYYKTGERYNDLYSAAEAGYILSLKTSKQDKIPEFLYYMSFSLLKTGDYEECAGRSEEAISRLLKLSKKGPLLKDVYILQSESLYKLGHYKKAYQAAESALSYTRRPQEQTEVNQQLGKIKKKL